MNKYFWIKIGLCAILVCTVIIIVAFYNDLAINFTKDNYKGEFFKVILTSFGGLGVIYGLYLNSKRIQEQTRQNNISEKVNIDKRFGEAIGYLNSDNIGVAIGGAYALHQLAKEDEIYLSIVGNIFAEFLSSNPQLENNRLYNIVIQLVFDEIFNKIKLNFRDVNFIANKFTNISNNSFYDCRFNNININGIDNCIFNTCYFDKLCLTKGCDLSFDNSIFENCKLFEPSQITIIDSIINKFSLISLSSNVMKEICFELNNEMKNIIINSKNKIDGLVLFRNSILDKIEIKSPLILNSNIEANSFISIVSDRIDDSNILGDKSIMTIMNLKEYNKLKHKEQIDNIIRKNLFN